MNEPRDLRTKAQLSLLPEYAFNQLCNALKYADPEEICRALLMYDITEEEEDQPTSSRECLVRLCTRPKPESCSLICNYPAYHFHSKKCAPIHEVFDRLSTIKHDITEILTDQVLEEVHRRLNSQSESPDEQEYIVYDMNFPNKNAVVLFWPNTTMVTESTQELLFRRWAAVRENLNQNFHLIMPHPNPLEKHWSLFLMDQLRQTHLIVIGPTAKFFEAYSKNEHFGICNGTSGCSAQQIECAHMLELICSPLDRTQLNSPAQRTRPLPPTVVVLAEREAQCNEAYKLSPMVYCVPNETDLMLRCLYQLHEYFYPAPGPHGSTRAIT